MSQVSVAAAPTYAWISGRSHGVDAGLVGETIAKIEAEEGSCPPQRFVDEVKPVSHPCHNLLEWDDGKAAKAHRVEQARRIIRSVKIIRYPDQQIPAFVSVRLPEQGVNGYISSERLLTNRDFKEFALRDAMRQLEGLRRRYAHLDELQSVWAAIDEAIE